MFSMWLKVSGAIMTNGYGRKLRRAAQEANPAENAIIAAPAFACALDQFHRTPSVAGPLQVKTKTFFRWTILTIALGLAAFADVSTDFAWKFTGPLCRPLGRLSDFLPPQPRSAQFPPRAGIPLRGWFIPRRPCETAVVLLRGHGSIRRQMASIHRRMSE